MEFNHIHLGAKNVGRSKEFYEWFFGFREKGAQSDGVLIENQEGFLISIDPVRGEGTPPSWLKLGFRLMDRNEVKRIYDVMKRVGIRFAHEYIEAVDSGAMFHCFDPDGTLIEVSSGRKS